MPSVPSPKISRPTSAKPQQSIGTRVIHGVAWNASYQIFSVLGNFLSMLVLMRIIAPQEYGKVASTIGVLSLINTFNCRMFIGQALQLRQEETPAWTEHFRAGVYIQGSLFTVCHLLALACWTTPHLRAIAPLLHLAAFGFLFDLFTQMNITMLSRAMDFRRLRVVYCIVDAVRLPVTLSLGIAGAGAYAIVLGGNVVSAIPFGVDLLFVRGWRPSSDWWRWPNWARYRPALRFGFQQAASSLLFSARGGLEATILPASLGFPNIGLWSRAQALFSTSVGRVGTVINESVYPVLPRHAANADRYPRQATLYLQALLWMAMPATVFLGFSGPALSRVLYGSKWVAADPMLWPGVLIGFGLLLFGTCSAILLAANRLRVCFSLDVTAACLCLPMLFVAWKSGSIATYAWAAAAGQLTASIIALVCASLYLQSDWFRVVLLPPLLASSAAILCMLAGGALGLWPPGVRLLGEAAVFGLIVVVTYHRLFASEFTRIMNYIPGFHHMRNWFGLPALSEGAAEAN